ncbi:MAG: SUMF1/EgtB/PvdO family nonheme iron enzyme [Dysgonomonas sp.]
MHKYLILALIFLAGTYATAQNKVTKKASPSTWESDVKKAKGSILQRLGEAKMPIETDIMKRNTPAKKIQIDVTGWDELVLYTLPTADGTNYDHAVWGDPLLTKTDGAKIWLDELKPAYRKSAYTSAAPNINFSGNTVLINGKKYPHGIMLHADGEMIYKLDKKYKTFEVEVGLDDQTQNVASVIFRVQNISGRTVAEELEKKYPNQVFQLQKTLNISLSQWLTLKNASQERTAVEQIINKLKNKSAFEKQLTAIAQNDASEQSLAYIELYDRINQVINIQEELKWVNLKAIRKALDDMKKSSGFDAEKYEKKYNELAFNYEPALKGIYSGNKADLEKARYILNLKKEILLANPLLDIDKIVVSNFNVGNRDRSIMADQLGMPANNWSSMYSAARNLNGEITELSNLRGNIEKRTIYKPQRNANIADLQMHWNGDKLLFSSVDDKNRWQVYEIGVDGKGLQQKITVNEPDLEFCDANYLPDGRIIASTNVGYHGVPCVNGSDAIGNLSIFNPKNGNFRRLTFDQDGNWNPVVMNNGRVMYTRWEYTDLTHYFSRIVMHMNPDGTENKALYGSGSFWPNSTFDIKPLPGSTTRFIGVISGHHGTARSGRLIIFDPAKSRKEEKGVIQELPYHDRKIIPEIKDYLVDGVWPQFVRPYPLSDEYFLVSAKLHPDGLWGIYLIDVFDNLTCIAEFEGEGLNAPLAVRQTKTPPVIPDRINLQDKESTVFIQDIYQGEGTEGVPKGTIKELRIFAYEYAYRDSPSDHYAQGIQSGWDIKRLLGTVPVEEDGSAIFKVPSNTPISIQPLDDKGRAIQWFRSWFTGMPGETVSCVGCHEDQNQIPIPKRVAASQLKPHPLRLPEGGQRPFTFELEMQPILDRACVSCHNGDKVQPNFTAGRMDTMYSVSIWSKSYLEFMPYIYRQGPEAEMYVLKPYEYHASNSEMVRMLEKGHHGVKLTDNEWRTLYTWIDFNAPYKSTFDNIRTVNGVDQYERRMELMEKYNDKKVDWKQEIRDYAKYLKGKGKIEPEMPAKEKKANYKEVKLKGWPFSAETAKQLQASKTKQPRIIEVAPGIEMKFVWVPAGEFVMGSNNAEQDCAPEFKASVKKGFWMSESEVTNEQFCALVPEHDSRIIGQFWKDHVHAGYWANKPKQPVIRVNFDEAMEYCHKLGIKNKISMSLPTETQWEWACRAGSGDAFWYGDRNTDFSRFENMADAQLSDMAVQGMDPQPMSKNNPLRKYWDYLPKESSVDDGEMLTAFVGKYESNPWGLKDMHGNVAEWTSSDYIRYPLKQSETSDRKVVRGGSWVDRPKYSTSYHRRAFYPWQKPYNVGFRVIIEE